MPLLDRFWPSAAALACALACTAERPGARFGNEGPVGGQGSAAATPIPPVPASWLPIEETWIEAAGGRRALIQGTRFELEGGALRQGAGEDPVLTGAVELPRALGTGFWFWNEHALYRAGSFTGPLEELGPTSGPIARLAFGPGFVLAHDRHGGHWLLDRGGKRIPARPIGIVDVATGDDGVAVALLAGGDVVTSRDQGKSWTSVARALGAAVVGLKTSEGRLKLELDTDPPSSAEILADGRVSLRLDRPGRARPRFDDPRWTSRETPLEEAIQRAGVRIAGSPPRAALVIDGKLASVDLGTGALLSIAPLPPDYERCELVSADELLLVCRSATALSITRTPLGTPQIERIFRYDKARESRSGPPAFAAGTLAVPARCNGSGDEPGVVCLRRAGGQYVEFDRTRELASLFTPRDAAAPEIAVIIPNARGGALLLVSKPKSALLDLETGATAAFPAESAAELAATAQPAQRVLVHNVFLAPDERLRVLGARASLAFRRDGTPEPSPYAFQTLGVSGSRALGVQSDGRAFQSEDWGESWVEVAAPPLPERSRSPVCSDVGCRLGLWRRIGWQATPPAPALVRRPSSPLLAPEPVYPELVCQEREAPRLSSVGMDDAGSIPANTGFGARRFPLLKNFRNHGYSLTWTYRVGNGGVDRGDHGLFAVSHGQVPARLVAAEGKPSSAALVGGGFSVDFRDPLDPAAWVRSSRVPWRTAALAARLLDLTVYLGAGDDSNSDVEGRALPVGSADGAAGVLVFDDALGLWIRPRGAVLGVAFGPTDFTVESAFAAGPDRVLLLGENSQGTQRVVMVGSSPRTLFELPARPVPAGGDAIALGPGGEVAVLHAPVGSEPPSESDPALLLRPGAAPQPLPSWSTLREGGAPECRDASADHRVLLLRAEAWIRLRAVDAPPRTDMLALVRVNGKRWCLDAVEMRTADAPLGESFAIPSAVVARFAPKPAAGRVGIARGGEFRQALSCELRPR